MQLLPNPTPTSTEASELGDKSSQLVLSNARCGSISALPE